MKNINNFHHLFSISLFLCILISDIFCQNSQELIVGWDTWEPYQYKNNEDIITGLDYELVSSIIKNMGYTPIFKEIPWKRILIEIEHGLLDITTGASKTAERENFAYFSQPYRSESVVLYIRKEDRDKYNFTNLTDIIGTTFKLGVTRGYYYGEEYQELINNPIFKKQVFDTTLDESNFKKLYSRRIDGFLVDPVVGTAGLRKEGLLDQVEILFSIYSNDIFVMFSKESISSELVELFNSSLYELKNNGIYDEILDKYLE